MSLFSGKPLTATSYVTSSQETPKWMQDAIYNQTQLAQQAAATPYQPYSLPTVAELSPLQQEAYRKVQGNTGAWQGDFNKVTQGFDRMANGNGTADQLLSAQQQYLRPDISNSALNAGQSALGQAAGFNAVGAAQPFLDRAGQATQQSIADRALSAADPYLQNAAQTSVQNIDTYMNPYNRNVTDEIARLGGRNLTENLLPGVSDSFIRAGQFGSNRMGEFGSRALRDTQEAVLGQQAQALQQGYGTSLTAAQGDLGRQAQLGQIAGGIAGNDLGRIQTAGAQFGNLGQTAGNLTSQQMQNLTSLGNTQSNIGYNQQNLGLNAAAQVQGAQAGDYERQMQALQGLQGAAQAGQGLRVNDAAALESAGAAMQGQQQSQLDAAYNQYMQGQNYNRGQLDWLNNQIRGIAPIVPGSATRTETSSGGPNGYGQSGLQNLATAYSAYKGI